MADDAPSPRLTAEGCRQQASLCRKMARAATVRAHEIMLEHMAQTWERLAADVRQNQPLSARGQLSPG